MCDIHIGIPHFGHGSPVGVFCLAIQEEQSSPTGAIDVAANHVSIGVGIGLVSVADGAAADGDIGFTICIVINHITCRELHAHCSHTAAAIDGAKHEAAFHGQVGIAYHATHSG